MIGRASGVFFVLAIACNGSSPACPDAGTCSDAAPDVAQVLSTFSASTAAVVLDPGDSHPIVVTLDRGTVTGNIDIAVQGLPAGVTQTPLTIMPGSSAGTFNLVAATTVSIPQDVDVTITATAGSSSLQTPLHVRVGSVFRVSTASESFVVPANLTSLVFQVWGAGGGAGGNGGVGGGGGFATAQVDVTPGETLAVLVGAGGGGGDLVPTIAWSGGGGGGYSAVLRGTDVLVIAGGGGGGGGTSLDGGALGFAGGGGGSDGLGACAGSAGTDAGAGDGGAPSGQNGSSLAGGAGGCDSVCAFVADGGAPGGGSGAIGNDAGSSGGGGGGGGAGFFGGGGGGSQGYGCGGGGGSAFASVSGASVKILAGSGQLPAGLNFVGYADSGAAVGGAIGDAGQGISGTSGLVAIAYPK